MKEELNLLGNDELLETGFESQGDDIDEEAFDEPQKAHTEAKSFHAKRRKAAARAKAYKVVKHAAPSGVFYDWFATHEVKMKTAFTQQEVRRTRRAMRMYHTDFYCYRYGKNSWFPKKHSRARVNRSAFDHAGFDNE
jgi:hypothetical protein